MNTTRQFLDRANALYDSQANRARQKKGLSGRISKKGYVLPFNREQFRAWFLAQFGGNEGAAIRCPYCNAPLDAYSCVVDHVIPLKRGGSPGLENLGLPCESCNQIKGGLKGEEFNWLLVKMHEMQVRFDAQAVTDVISRLAKAVKLATMARRNISMAKRGAVPANVHAAARAPQVTSFDDSDF